MAFGVRGPGSGCEVLGPIETGRLEDGHGAWPGEECHAWPHGVDVLHGFFVGQWSAGQRIAGRGYFRVRAWGCWTLARGLGFRRGGVALQPPRLNMNQLDEEI